MEDSLIRYSETNILENVKPKLNGATVSDDEVYYISAGGVVRFELSGETMTSVMKKSAKNMMFSYVFKTDSKTNYSKKIGFNVYFVYSGYTNMVDKFTLNMFGSEVSAEGVQGYNEINTRGYSFTSIIIEMFNISDSPLVVRGLGVYKSIDLQVDQIVEVLEQDAVSIDTLMAKSAWIENMQVEVLETNTKAKSVKWGSADNRDFITIKENAITLGVEELEQADFEQLCIDINGTPTPLWYTAINENKYAYKFVTINPPKSYIPDITDEEAQKYAYMVYKSKSIANKMKIEIVDGNPRITFGVGTVGNDRNLGKGFIQKDKDVLKIEKHHNTDAGVTTGIYLQDTGSYMKGFDNLPTRVEISYNHINVKKADGTSIGFNVITDSNGNITALESSTGKVIQFVVNL